MATRPSEEFKREAVRIALTSGLTRRQASSDLGVGMSTLGKWIKTYRDGDVVSNEDQELAKENERLRRENRLLREERELLKKATIFFADQSK
jgi:transposase